MNITIASDRLVLDAGSYITTIMGSDILDVRAEPVKNGQKVDFRVRIVRRAGTDVYIDLTTPNPPYRAWSNNMGGAAQCVADISAIAGVSPAGSTIIVIGGTEVSNFLWTTASLNLTNASMTLASNALSLSVHPPQTGFTTATTTGTNVVGTLGLNGLSMGIPAYVTATGGGGGAITVSAGTLSGSRDSLVFSNLNGVSFGMSGSTITGSVQTNYAPSNVTSGRAGTGVTTATTAGTALVATLNTNGLSAGIPAWLTTAQPPGAYLTTAMPSNAGSNFVQATATIAGTNISGTIASNVISLSVAAQSADANKAGTGFTSTTTAGTAVVGTLGTNGLSMAVPAYITTAMSSNAGSNFVQATAAFNGTNISGTIASSGISVSVDPAGMELRDAGVTTQFTAMEFVNSNGVSWSLNSANSRLVASVQTNYLTSQSNQAFSADASSTFQTLSFQNSNGVSFSNNAGAIRVTHALQFTSNTSAITSNALNTSASRVINIVAATNNTGGGTASLSSNVSFSAANGITFYTSAGGAVVASHNALTSQSNQAFSASGGSSAFQTLNFANSNGVTFSNSAGSVIASYTVPSTAGLISAIRVSAGTTSNNMSAITFSNSNNASFGLNGSVVTAIFSQSVQTIGFFASGNTTYNSTGTQDARVVTVVGSGNVSVGLTNGSLVVYDTGAAGGGITNINVSAGTTSNNLSNIVFSNSGGVSFGLNGSTLTADVFTRYAATGFTSTTTAGTAVVATLQTNGLSMAVPAFITAGGGGGAMTISAGTLTGTRDSLVFANFGNVSFGMSGSTITANAAAELNVSAGTEFGSVSYMNWVDGGGVSFWKDGFDFSAQVRTSYAGLNTAMTGGQMTVNTSGISINVGKNYSGYAPWNKGVISVAGQQGAGTMHIQPMWNAPAFQYDRVLLPVQISNASNSSGSWTMTMSVGIYTLSGSTLSLVGSASNSWNHSGSGTVGNYTLFAGPRNAIVSMTSTLLANDYWVGVWSRTTTGGAAGQTLNQLLASQLNSAWSGELGIGGPATRRHVILGQGIYSVSFSTAMPNSIALSDIQGTASIILRPPIIAFQSGTV